jgi:prefoldin subunit 5
MASAITISDIGSSVLDSRDLDELLSELKSENEDLTEARDDAQNDVDKAQEALQEAEDTLRDAKINGAGDNALEELYEAVEEAEQALQVEEQTLEDAQEALDEFNSDHASLIRDLEDASDEVGDWIHGETLIHEDYWVEYVEEMLKDCGYLPKDIPWWIEIDMDKTADNVKMDYSELMINGETYYYRA